MKSIYVFAFIITLASYGQGFVVDVDVQQQPLPRPPRPSKHGIDIVVERPYEPTHEIILGMSAEKPQPPKQGIENPIGIKPIQPAVEEHQSHHHLVNSVENSKPIHHINGMVKPKEPKPQPPKHESLSNLEKWQLSHELPLHGLGRPQSPNEEAQKPIAHNPVFGQMTTTFNLLKPQPPKHEMEKPLVSEPEYWPIIREPVNDNNHHNQHELPHHFVNGIENPKHHPAPQKPEVEEHEPAKALPHGPIKGQMPPAWQIKNNQQPPKGPESKPGKFEPTPKYPKELQLLNQNAN